MIPRDHPYPELLELIERDPAGLAAHLREFAHGVRRLGMVNTSADERMVARFEGAAEVLEASASSSPAQTGRGSRRTPRLSP